MSEVTDYASEQDLYAAKLAEVRAIAASDDKLAALRNIPAQTTVEQVNGR